jgi:hypothetical protein
LYCRCFKFLDWLILLHVLLYILGLVCCSTCVLINCGICWFYCTCCYILWDCLIVLHVLLYIVGLVEYSAGFAIYCRIGSLYYTCSCKRHSQNNEVVTMTMVDIFVRTCFQILNVTVLMLCSLAYPFPADRHSVRGADLHFPEL